MRTLMWIPARPGGLGPPGEPHRVESLAATTATSRTRAQGTPGTGSRSIRSSSGWSRSSARTGCRLRSRQPRLATQARPPAWSGPARSPVRRRGTSAWRRASSRAGWLPGPASGRTAPSRPVHEALERHRPAPDPDQRAVGHCDEVPDQVQLGVARPAGSTPMSGLLTATSRPPISRISFRVAIGRCYPLAATRRPPSAHTRSGARGYCRSTLLSTARGGVPALSRSRRRSRASAPSRPSAADPQLAVPAQSIRLGSATSSSTGIAFQRGSRTARSGARRTRASCPGRGGRTARRIPGTGWSKLSRRIRSRSMTSTPASRAGCPYPWRAFMARRNSVAVGSSGAVPLAATRSPRSHSNHGQRPAGRPGRWPRAGIHRRA